jgi:cytidylate kinase
VVGDAGSGTSRHARRIADELDLAHVEFDAVHHLANWEPIDPDELRERAEPECRSALGPA